MSNYSEPEISMLLRDSEIEVTEELKKRLADMQNDPPC